MTQLKIDNQQISIVGYVRHGLIATKLKTTTLDGTIHFDNVGRPTTKYMCVFKMYKNHMKKLNNAYGLNQQIQIVVDDETIDGIIYTEPMFERITQGANPVMQATFDMVVNTNA